MKLRKNRRGFTIVELVIVVAVIGVIAAILIPTFVNLTNKANSASDNSLVANLNKALAGREAETDDTKNETMHDAVEDLEKWGYKLENLMTKHPNDHLLYNLKENRFLLESKADESKASDYWQIVDSIPSVQKYNYYASNKFKAETVNVSTGFDAGDFTGIGLINYTNASSIAKEIVIRTNTSKTELEINGYVNSQNKTGDVINHFGPSGSLNVIKCATKSYHESGDVAFAEVAAGRIVLENESSMEHVHFNSSKLNEGQENETVAFDEIVISKEESTSMPKFSRDPVEIPDEGVLVVALENGDDTDYIWLTNVGVYEQVVVSDNGESPVSSDNTTTYAAESGTEAQQEVALQIANNITVNIEGEDYSVTAVQDEDGNWDYVLVDEGGNTSEDYTINGEPTVTVTTTTEGEETTTTTTVTVDVLDEDNQPVETEQAIENGMSKEDKEAAKEELVDEATASEIADDKEEDSSAVVYNMTTKKDYEDLYTAIEEVPNNTKTTLALLKNVSGVSNKSYSISKDKNIIFDLNGHKFNIVAPDGNIAYAFDNEGTLTIKDNTDKNKDGTGKGKLEFNALNPDLQDIPGYASNVITNKGTLTVESGWIYNASTGYAAFAIDTYSNNGKNTSLTINGGRVTTNAALSIRQAVFTNTTNNVVINGGVVGSYWIQNYGTASASAQGTLKINNVQALYGYRLDLGYSIDNGYNILADKVLVTINGGYFQKLNVYERNNAKIDIIKGGSFSTNVSAYCQEGYFAKEVDGRYEVRPISQATDEDYVAYVGDKGYLDIETAIKESNGATIKLNKDLKGYLTFNNGGTYVLDLNGHNIANYSGSGNTDTINVYKNTHLTITDTSTGPKGTISSEVGCAIWTGSPATDTSTIVINGGVNIVGATYSIQASGGTTTITINSANITGEFDINPESTLIDNRNN